jgi:hypothetical protein
MSELFLRYRGQRVRFDLPQPWELLTFAAFEDRPEPTDVIGMVRRALREPVNHPPLPQVVGLSDKVAIIIEVGTARITPRIV